MRAQNLPPLNMSPPQSILVRGVNWLGDAVMTTPALLRLRQARPGARLTLLAPEKLAGLWEGQPFVDEVLAFSPSETLWHVSRRLREKRFTTGVAFPNSLRAALELWLAGIPERIGAARPGRGFFLTKSVAPPPGAVMMRKRSPREIQRLLARATPPPAIPAEAHHVYHYLHLAGALDASTEPLAPRLEVAEEQMDEVRRKFGLAREGGGPWFGLIPGAEYGPAKRWPPERFVAAAAALRQKTQCRWVLFGGAGDCDLAGRIARDIPGAALNLAGKTTLRELAAALKICNLVLTNDTGPMHLAAAVGAPVVAVFGSTSPELTGPLFSPRAQIVRQPVPCAPCFRRQCPIDLRCLRGIPPESVVEAALRRGP
ncbi:MAG: lipopolysaccharide heptosyltransferase II [Verrucomicrobiota bacterium]|jgi:heptosyltransferase-2